MAAGAVDPIEARRIALRWARSWVELGGEWTPVDMSAVADALSGRPEADLHAVLEALRPTPERRHLPTADEITCALDRRLCAGSIQGHIAAARAAVRRKE